MCEEFESNQPWVAIPGDEGNMSPLIFGQKGTTYRHTCSFTFQLSIINQFKATSLRITAQCFFLLASLADYFVSPF